MSRIRGAAIILAALASMACADQDPATAKPSESSSGGENPAKAKSQTALIDAAVKSARRDPADRADDANRNPAAVLAFTGIEPGMTVYEMEAGAGYYTEMFSVLVGPGGSVIMQNPPSFDGFLGKAVSDRLKNNRLTNVQYDKTNFDQLNVDDASADIVTWFLGPHELYFTPSDGVSLGEVEQTYTEIFRILKPGGAFVVLDHAAAPGSGEETGNALHRIDPAIVKDLAVSAGFDFLEDSDILRNGEDDYSKGVFDPSVRRKTDRFLIKFRKPL
ncbi:MAG: class I SAM-dependent methyltransferase [Pseudomonadota bacterium]